MGHAGLGFHLDEIENRHARGLAAGASGGGNGDQRFERAGHWLTPANGRVDVGEEIGWVRGVHVGGFGRVHHRSSADGDEPVKSLLGELNRRLERGVGRLDAHLVEKRVLDARLGNGR